MTGSVRATAQREVHASLEEPIQNCFGQVAIMHDISHGRQWFVGGELAEYMLNLAATSTPIILATMRWQKFCRIPVYFGSRSFGHAANLEVFTAGYSSLSQPFGA